MTKGMGRLGKDALVRETMAVLAVNATASMSDVASELGVGRTTLYRHFGDREAMIAEVARLGARMFGQALMSARPESGPGLDAVERVCTQLFTVPDVLTLMFADDPIISDDVFAEAERERRAEAESASVAGASVAGGGEADDDDASGSAGDGDVLEAVIARGQSDGSITAEVPVVWAAMYVFLTIGSGHLFSVTSGETGPDGRAHALALTIRAVRKTLSSE